MGASDGRRGHLFRLDCRIARNATRAALAGRRDRLNAGFMLVVVLAALHAWFAGRSWQIGAWAALGGGACAGVAAGRLIAARLHFHGTDGLLAALALRPSTGRHYRLAAHGIGVAILATITLIARPSLLIVSLPAYLAGAAVAHLTAMLAPSGAVFAKVRLGWTIRIWLHRPGAGMTAAAAVLLSLVVTGTLSSNARIAIVGIEAVIATLALTSVDHPTVRFMTVAGQGSWRIVAHHGRSMLPFVLLAVPITWLILGPLAAGIVAAACGAMLLLMTMRILAYRLHGRRFADLLVSVFAGMLILTAYMLPPALPVAALAILWHLHRRAAAKTWLLG
ncbi:hypothetical protein [Allosphingosinicella deserti]|uniref:Uncharacterized protein n=1 Tax=Allosphingosinicella deserti TaxID=2116704 RepID=A0A2P7QY89_9SPHN|nr:hypothetical protein [Sphingomonas deserti]PSJ42915.1 hypothetical protein C7I55_00385 [Sphingomonas deserti]